jgi:hypothetical protein
MASKAQMSTLGTQRHQLISAAPYGHRGAFARIEDAIAAIRQGEMVIVADDEDRKNEGDLTMAAEMITPEAINFMAKHGRGLICLAMTPERLDKLEIPLMSPTIARALRQRFASALRRGNGRLPESRLQTGRLPCSRPSIQRRSLPTWSVQDTYSRCARETPECWYAPGKRKRP